MGRDVAKKLKRIADVIENPEYRVSELLPLADNFVSAVNDYIHNAEQEAIMVKLIKEAITK